MVKYLGNSTFVKKQTRMDKVRLKEELHFENKTNPIIAIFSRLDYMIEKRMVEAGFNALK